MPFWMDGARQTFHKTTAQYSGKEQKGAIEISIVHHSLLVDTIMMTNDDELHSPTEESGEEGEPHTCVDSSPFAKRTDDWCTLLVSFALSEKES